ncbi:MAG: hypothetical protein V2A79_00005, partial [Planctomycetota bacterium]
VLVMLWLIGQFNRPSAELAHTAHEAVLLAREADSSVVSATLWSGCFRLLAIGVGVAVPLVVAYLIWKSASNSEPEVTEILDAAEPHLLGPGDAPQRPPLTLDTTVQIGEPRSSNDRPDPGATHSE